MSFAGLEQEWTLAWVDWNWRMRMFLENRWSIHEETLQELLEDEQFLGESRRGAASVCRSRRER